MYELVCKTGEYLERKYAFEMKKMDKVKLRRLSLIQD